jgi:hypothetical protein
MGHVLGIGTIWSSLGLLEGAGTADPRFTGEQATAEYNSIFGGDESSVPVEAGGGSGTRDMHFRESVFNHELMTGWLDSTMPLSRITAGSLADIGYDIHIWESDSYSAPAPTAPIRFATAGGFAQFFSNSDGFLRLTDDINDIEKLADVETATEDASRQELFAQQSEFLGSDREDIELDYELIAADQILSPESLKVCDGVFSSGQIAETVG